MRIRSVGRSAVRNESKYFLNSHIHSELLKMTDLILIFAGYEIGDDIDCFLMGEPSESGVDVTVGKL